MLLSVLSQALSGHMAFSLCGSADPDVTEIAYSSAQCLEGTLFVCLRGARADGHAFAADAYARGTRAFVCDHVLPPQTLPADAAQLVCADTRAALPLLAAEFFGHPAKKLHLIGITGTCGKTTTALLTAGLLCAAGRPCASIGTNGVAFCGGHYDTVNTTPESLALQRFFARMVESGVQYVAMEVSSQALATHRVDSLTFDIAVFMNFSPDHIGTAEHRTLEEYRAAKRRLFTEHGARTIVYNAADPEAEAITGGTSAQYLSFSPSGRADCFASDVIPRRSAEYFGSEFTLRCRSTQLPNPIQNPETARVRLPLPGACNVENALAALLAARVCGVSFAEGARALEQVRVDGRCAVVPNLLPDRTFVIDYAHNAGGMESILSSLRAFSPKRLVCLFGAVGSHAEVRRQQLAHAVSHGADFAILTTDNPDNDDPKEIMDAVLQFWDGPCPVKTVEDREQAIRLAAQLSRPGDIVLLAGKGHETYQILHGRHVPFSEKDILRRACAEIASAGR